MQSKNAEREKLRSLNWLAGSSSGEYLFEVIPQDEDHVEFVTFKTTTDFEVSRFVIPYQQFTRLLEAPSAMIQNDKFPDEALHILRFEEGPKAFQYKLRKLAENPEYIKGMFSEYEI